VTRNRQLHQNVFIELTLGLICWLVLAGALMAQIGGNGMIQGSVTDPSGAVIPGATVVGTNEATQVKTTVKTTNRGFYVLSPLPPGDYTVIVRAPGFKPLAQEHVVVNALARVGLNLTLQVGATTQTVTVSAAPSRLNTTNGTLGATIPQHAYLSLPIAMNNNPRSPEGFVTLLPGVNSGNDSQSLHVNGGSGYTGITYLNGQPMIYNELGNDSRGLNIGVSVNAVQQFQLDTNGTPAMYQGQGSQNYVIKSGTNQFHGQAYEFLRNTSLDSRPFFDSTTPVEIQNEFGANIGGPILKNKIFFFANYDGYRRRLGTEANYASIPTAAERNGDFSALLNLPTPDPIYNPATTSCNAAGQCTRQAFPNNIIPPGDISPISKSLQSYLPAPTNSDVLNNFLEPFPNGYGVNEYQTRVDINFSDRDRMWVYDGWGKNYDVGVSPPGNYLPLPYAESRDEQEGFPTAQIGETHTFTPTLLNQFQFGFDRLGIPLTNYTMGGDYATKAGLTGLPPGQAADAFPRVNWSGVNAPSMWGGNGAEAFNEFDDNYALTDNVEWVHGAHDVQFGTQLMYEKDTYDAPDLGSYPASFNFSNSETAGFLSSGALNATSGNSYASYLLGELDGASIGYDASADTGTIDKRYGFYVQDNWKATRRLTLNLGLRYDVFTPFVEMYNRFSFLNPALANPETGNAGALQFAGFGPNSCHCRTPIETHYGDVGPRLGLAYMLNRKTVLRASWGMFYDRAAALGGGIDTNASTLSSLGFSNGPIITSPNPAIGTPALNWNSGIPSFVSPPVFNPTLNTGYNTTAGPKGGSITFGDPYLGGMPVQEADYSFTLERQITPSTVVNASYSGSQSHFVPTTIGRGIYSHQILPQYLALGNYLGAQATPANLAAANTVAAAQGLHAIQLPYATFDGTIGQALTPFPQYAGISDPYSDIGNEYYNSLQIMVQHRTSKGLWFLASYTASKLYGDAGSLKGSKGGGLSTSQSGYLNNLAYAVAPSDTPQALTASEVYALPFGAGHRLGSGNKVVSALASNWEVSGIETYMAGYPLTNSGGPIGANCNAPYTGGCFASFNPSFTGSARINGSYGNGNLLGAGKTSYLNPAAFEDPAPFTFGDTPPTLAYDLRGPAYMDEDFALMRTFKITERLSFQFEAEAFDAFNRFIPGSPNVSNINNSSFGEIGGQANAPRTFQFSGQVNF
jgi:hypothetical protein